MTVAAPLSPAESDSEIASLVETLRLTERRLEELTGGHVDSLIDSEGRTFVLQRAQNELRRSEEAKQSALLDSLPAHAALLDAEGVIISVNEAWRRFARENALQGPVNGVGVNYIGVCDRAQGTHATEAREVAAGIRAVLAGTAKNFSIEYPCHSPVEQRWYLLTVSPIGDDRSKGAVLMHMNVTARTQATAALKKLSQHTERREKLLNMTFSSISDFAYALDRQGRFLFANKPLLDLWGTTLEEAVGRTFLEVGYTADAAAELQRDLETVLATKGKVSGEIARLNLAGHQSLYEYVFSPALAADGTVDFVVGCSRDITARRQADDQVRTSQRHLRNLIDGLGPSMFVGLLTPEGILIEVNESPLATAGLKRADVLGRPFVETHWWSHSPSAQQQLREAIVRAAHGDASHYEVQTRGVGDDTIDIDFSLQPLRDENGKVAFLIPSAIVITERKRAETLLRNSEAEFRTLAESVPQIVWVTTSDGRALYLNQHWIDYTGLTLEESLGQGWNVPFHPEEQRRAWVARRQAAATVSSYSFEARMRRADGEYRWWLVQGVPQPDTAGNISKWFGTCTNIHDLKLAELERLRINRDLQRQRTELRVLFDLVPAMIWFKDTENNILRVNQRVADLAGLSVAQIEGKPSVEIYPHEAAAYYAADLEVIRSEQPKRIVETVQDGKGNELWVQTDKVPYRDDNGKVIGIVVMAQDITERKNDQDALRELNNDLEARVTSRTAELNLARNEADQANHAKSAFLASMSHEIRTPMNGVIGMMDVLNQTSLQDHQVEMVDLVRDSAYSLLGIIDNILDFSKIEAGKLEVDVGPLRLRHVVEKVCGMLDHLAVKSDVGLMVFVDPAIPSTILGDETRLRQVLLNLTGNAIKFSGGRGQRGQVSVRVLLAAREPHFVTVDWIVADNGIGMDAETIGRLFTPFSQGDVSTTRRYGGTGLGLVISQMLVRLMEGTIAVESAPGQGSTFTVRLRFAIPEAPDEQGHTEQLVTGLRCRIVGGDTELAGDLSAYLTPAGAVVERSISLEAAAAEPGRTGKWLWIILPGPDVPPLAELRAMAATPGGETAFLVLGRGKRRRARVEAPDLLTIDADVLSRRTFFHALAVASGRANEDVPIAETDAVMNAEVAPLRRDAKQQGRLILVAEDNETNRKVIMHQLQLIGYAAEVAVNGRDALVRWRSGDFALLLTDLHMPEMDGYQLTAAIRAEEKDGRRAPIIALTANALRDEQKRCLDAGMNAYLTKPVRLPELKAVIEEWLAPALPAAASLSGNVAITAAAAPVDLAVLRLLIGDDEGVISEVLKSFRESAEQSSADIKQGSSDRSMHAVVDAAHKLKSGARAIGALRLGEICADIEQKAPSLGAEALDTLLGGFDTELEAVYAHLDSR